MGKVNRRLMVLKAKPPYFEWAKAACDSKTPFTLEDLRRNCSAWLFPADEPAKDYLRENFDDIFRRELFGITYDERQFPPNRTFELFNEWFELEIHHSIIDLDDRPLKNR